jgi:hypothetical protein
VERFLRMLEGAKGQNSCPAAVMRSNRIEEELTQFPIIPQRVIERGIAFGVGEEEEEEEEDSGGKRVDLRNFRKRRQPKTPDSTSGDDMNQYMAEYMVKRAKWYPHQLKGRDCSSSGTEGGAIEGSSVVAKGPIDGAQGAVGPCDLSHGLCDGVIGPCETEGLVDNVGDCGAQETCGSDKESYSVQSLTAANDLLSSDRGLEGLTWSPATTDATEDSEVVILEHRYLQQTPPAWMQRNIQGRDSPMIKNFS